MMHNQIRPCTTPSVLLLTCIIALFRIIHCSETDSQRLEHLNALRRSASKGFIPITIDRFKRFIETAPRTYGIFVMFSAPSTICKPCATFSTQISNVAADYYKLPSHRAANKPIFFAQVKLSHTDEAFLTKYRILHVPIFFYFPPGRTKSYPKPLEETSANDYPIQKLGSAANPIKEFINARTGSRLKIVRGNYQIPFVETVRRFIPLILLIVAIFAGITMYTEMYKKPMLWFGLVMLVYIFSVGGGHYSWIHNVPLAFVNKDGRVEYVASGSRSQYVVEGFFVSATCVSISALVILIQELPSVMPNKTGQTFVGTAFFVMTIFAIAALLVMYQVKMPQYLQYTELS